MIFLLLIVELLTQQVASADCRLPRPLRHFNESGVLIWTLEKHPVFENRNVLAKGPYQDYRLLIQTWVETDYNYLVTQTRNSPNHSWLAEKMLDNRIGFIRPVNCLESLLLGIHQSINPLTESNTEFRAFVLTKGNRLKIFMMSGHRPGQVGTPEFVFQSLSRHINQGWAAFIDIHNHPFNIWQVDGDWNLGALPVPSHFKPPSSEEYVGDLRSYRYLVSKYGLKFKKYLTTNGFHTGVLSHQDLVKALMFD